MTGNTKPKTGIAYFVLVLILVFWITNWIMLRDNPDRGIFGDMFGAVNSLFSGLAIFGIIWAIILQQHEIKLQIKEMTAHGQQFKDQSETLKKQQFESTFFQMVRLLFDRIEYLDYHNAKKLWAFKEFYNVVRGKFSRLSSPSDKEQTELIILSVLDGNETWVAIQLTPYFWQLYEILNLIDLHSPLDTETYIGSLRSALSVYEKLLLFYYSLSLHAPRELKSLIEKYHLFSRLQTAQLPFQQHKEFYSRSAFTI